MTANAASAVIQVVTQAASSPLQIAIVSTPASASPHWTAYLQAIGTPIVAVIAAGIAASIAYRQWKTAHAAVQTAKNKLKLDLFDKRFAVYQAASQLIVHMCDDKTHDNEAVRGLLVKFGGAEFLFDEDVDNYLTDELMKHVASSMSLQVQRIYAKHEQNTSEVEALTIGLKAEVEWFNKQLDVLRSRMRPFLLLTH